MAPLARLKKRAEFLHVANAGRRWTTPGLILQALPQEKSDEPRVGFTASRRVGIAVLRNRARRRLREAARQAVSHALPGDYVVVARSGTLTRAFPDLVDDLETALRKLGLWREEAKR
jgi:ribonuclease P protein component